MKDYLTSNVTHTATAQKELCDTSGESSVTVASTDCDDDIVEIDDTIIQIVTVSSPVKRILILFMIWQLNQAKIVMAKIQYKQMMQYRSMILIDRVTVRIVTVYSLVRRIPITLTIIRWGQMKINMLKTIQYRIAEQMMNCIQNWTWPSWRLLNVALLLKQVTFLVNVAPSVD